MLNSPGQYNRNLDDIYAYLTMAIGLSYLLLSWSFSNTWNKNLVGLLNFFGSVGFFSAAFYKVFDNYGIWELLFFVLTIGGMAYAVSIKSKSILVISTMFLVSHLMHITSKYFADSIGWPISLVILGFIIIGLGYFSISLSKKYLST
jgi:uncharacterized integral membrane protein